MSEAHEGFLVKQHRPFFKGLMIALSGIILVVTFFIGRWDQDRSLEQSYDMIQELNTSINQLVEHNDGLVIKNARLSSGSKVDRDAYNAVNKSLNTQQKEVLALKEELVFYRGIVAPSQVNLGVNLQEFNMTQTSEEGFYRYKLVLTKTGRSKFSIRGDVNMSIKGLVDGKSKSLALIGLSDLKKNELKYSFKYFQIFEGEIELPKQFYPEKVVVGIKSKTKKVKSTENTFNWAELVSGET